MGAWGYGPFENDGAGDLIAQIRHGDFSFENVAWAFEDPDYLEIDGGQIAVALAALVRVIRGDCPSPEPGLDLDQFEAMLSLDRLAWIQAQLDRALADAKSSELYELWAETDKFESWFASSVGKQVI